MAWTSAAQASDLCAKITGIANSTSSKLSGIEPETVFSNAAQQFKSPTTCTVSKELSGSSSYICYWEFGYRAPDASSHFQTLDGSMNGCFGNNAQVKKDLAVNHPDFYDLKTYEIGETILSISIKDKAALEKTFVFLRIEGID